MTASTMTTHATAGAIQAIAKTMTMSANMTEATLAVTENTTAVTIMTEATTAMSVTTATIVTVTAMAATTAIKQFQQFDKKISEALFRYVLFYSLN